MIISIQNRKTCSEKPKTRKDFSICTRTRCVAFLRDAGMTRNVPFLPSNPFLSEWRQIALFGQF